MLEFIVSVILLPLALLAVAFSLGFVVALIQTVKEDKRDKKG